MATSHLNEIARRMGVQPEEAARALNGLVQRIWAEVATRGHANIRGLGTFRREGASFAFEPEETLAQAVNATYAGLEAYDLPAPGGEQPPAAEPVQAPVAAPFEPEEIPAADPFETPVEEEAEEAVWPPFPTEGVGEEEDQQPIWPAFELPSESEPVWEPSDAAGPSVPGWESEEPEDGAIYNPYAALDQEDEPARNPYAPEDSSEPETNWKWDLPEEETEIPAPGAAWSFQEPEEKEDSEWNPFAAEPDQTEPEPEWKPFGMEPDTDQEEPAWQPFAEEKDDEPEAEWKPFGPEDEPEVVPAYPVEIRDEEEEPVEEAEPVYEDVHEMPAGEHTPENEPEVIFAPSRGAVEPAVSTRRRSPWAWGVPLLLFVAAGALFIYLRAMEGRQRVELPDRSAPVAMDTSRQAVAAADSDTVAVQAPVSTRPLDPLRGREPIDASSGGWTWVIGSSTDQETAVNMAGRIREQGFRSSVLHGDYKGVSRYRVAVGQFASSEEALRARKTVAGIAKDAWLLPVQNTFTAY